MSGHAPTTKIRVLRPIFDEGDPGSTAATVRRRVSFSPIVRQTGPATAPGLRPNGMNAKTNHQTYHPDESPTVDGVLTAARPFGARAYQRL